MNENKRKDRSSRARQNTVPCQESRVLILDRENGLAKLLNQLTVVNVDRVDGQRCWELWELKHLSRFKRRSER